MNDFGLGETAERLRSTPDDGSEMNEDEKDGTHPISFPKTIRELKLPNRIHERYLTQGLDVKRTEYRSRLEIKIQSPKLELPRPPTRPCSSVVDRLILPYLNPFPSLFPAPDQPTRIPKRNEISADEEEPLSVPRRLYDDMDFRKGDLSFDDLDEKSEGRIGGFVVDHELEGGEG